MLANFIRDSDRPGAPIFADVIVPRHLTKTFTYLVPPSLVGLVGVGQLVVVPFGRTQLEGAVVGLTRNLPGGVSLSQLKMISSLSDGEGLSGLSPGMLELSRQVAEEYIAPWGQCLRLIAPSARGAEQQKWSWVLTPQGRLALEEGICPEVHLPLLQRIARREKGLSIATIQKSRSDRDRQTLTFLEVRQWIVRSEAAVSGRSSRLRGNEGESELTHAAFEPLIPDEEVMQRVQMLVRAARATRVLVEGGLDYRIGIMARAAQLTLDQGRSVLIIIGEVVRAQWLAQVLQEATKASVTVHPSTASGGDADRNGKAVSQILVGTRSAIFGPLRSIGMIWVDGEEDTALKEPQEPRYHVREVAWMRAQQESALLVYGSAHPSLEVRTLEAIERLVQRREPASFPQVDLVDMGRETVGGPFSATLLDALRATLLAQDRVILFLNRLGYAGTLVCRDCGWVPRCPSCSVALVYYRQSAHLACRYCGRRELLPETCGACGASRLNPLGEGTEGVEQEVRRLFPGARVLRIDRDTVRGVAATRRLWKQVYARAWDILIGTQALFQREPIAPVGLVGIVQADSGLHLPDFRAAERTHQLLVDAVDLARPSPAGGRVILQTSLPMHHVMEAITGHEPARFYDEEIEARRLLGYPPVQHLIYLTVAGKDRRLTESAARRWVSELHTLVPTRPAIALPIPAPAQRRPSDVSQTQGIAILGPVAAVGVGSTGMLGWHIMVKGDDRRAMRAGVRRSLEIMEQAYPRRACKFSVDVDPVSMG